MSQMVVTGTKLQNGVWQGIVSGTGDAMPRLTVTHLDVPLTDVTLSIAQEDPGAWLLQFPVPAAAISEGVQTILITDDATGDRLDCISLMAGEVLGEDLRAEVDLLRAELDMLKRAFRHHCSDTE